MQTFNGVALVFGDSHHVSRSVQTRSEASDNQLADVERRRGRWRGGIADVENALVFADNDIIDQAAVADDQLRPHARRNGFQILRTDGWHEALQRTHKRLLVV